MGEMTMKRKLWVILSLVLVLSIAYSSSAFAVNPVADTFLGGSVVLQSAINATAGYGSLLYSNSGHPGTTYTTVIQITYTYYNPILFPIKTMHTVKSTSSVQNGNAYVSYAAPSGYSSFSVQNYGKISKLGEICTGTKSTLIY
jgi:hypothetical protein